MKRHFTIASKFAAIGLALVGLVALLPNLIQRSTVGAAGVAATNLNPLQIAILHWYDVNKITRFFLGNSPWGVAFDRDNIWVSAQTGLRKLRANSGLVLGTFLPRHQR
jgi:hypothetical protein